MVVRASRALPLARATKQQRRGNRAAAGTLRSLQLQPRTLTRYAEAAKFFFNWLAEHGEPMPESVAATDEVLGEFLEDCWAQGESKSIVGDVLSGLQHFVPSLRRALNDSWRLFSTWSKNEVPSRARPLLPEQALAMAGFALSEGDTAMAAAVLVSFNGFLRPVEVMLQASQCTWDLDRGIVHINLGFTKSGKRAGVAEHVIIDELEAVILLARVLGNAPGGTQLFPRGTASFRAKFSRLVARIGGNPTRYRPYSLRRGGATHHFQVIGSLSKTCVRGRWRHQPTARIYIQDGVAMLERGRLTCREKTLLARGKALLRRLP